MTFGARLVFLTALMLAAGVGGALADTQADRQTINRQTREDFGAERFELLEETAATYLRTRAVNTNGDRRLASFYQGLMDAVEPKSPADAEDAIERARGFFRRWLKAYPRSKPAAIMLAHVAVAHAWVARGSGTISSVSLIQWELFTRRLESAWRLIEDANALAGDDPQWHATALSIARGAGFPDAEYDAMAAKALDLDPVYGFTHEEILLRKEPKWGGSWEAYDAAVNDIVARTIRERGQSFYALGYDRLRSSSTRRLAKWPRFKQGYEDVVAQFPSARNLNTFAAFACFHGDMPTASAVLERIGSRLDKTYWAGLVQMDSCIYAANRRKIEAEDQEHYAKSRPPTAAERAERNAITGAAAEDFVAGRFEQLDATHARYLSEQDRTESGEWKLEYFYEGLTQNMLLYAPGARIDQPTFDRIDEQLQKWLAGSPSSKPAAIAAARISWLRARVLRQPIYQVAATDSRNIEAFKLLAKARDQLEAARASASDDPEWWATKLAVERDDRASEETLNALAGEAFRREPTYAKTLSEILQRGTARSLGDFDGLVQTVLAAGPPDALAETYARSYLWLAQISRRKTLIDDARPKWAVLKNGLDILVARRPTDWNLNGYANLACLAKDRLAAKLILTRIDGRIVEERWNDWRSVKACSQWAGDSAD